MIPEALPLDTLYPSSMLKVDDFAVVRMPLRDKQIAGNISSTPIRLPALASLADTYAMSKYRWT